MPIPIGTEPVEYVLRIDRKLPPERQTVFLLQPLTAAEDFALQNRISKQQAAGAIEVGGLRQDLLRRGLVGVRNFRDVHGGEIPFETDKSRMIAGRASVSDAFLDRLASSDRTELAEAIQEGARVTEDEAKNS